VIILFRFGEGKGMADTRHKVFISYYHKDDDGWRQEFENKFAKIFINKSVQKGDIDTDVSTEYIKRLIQKDYITDTSVLVVLIGPNTWGRKHVDWEISAAISKKIGGYSGLLGIILPTHQNYTTDSYTPDIVPTRLADNQKSGYAKIYNWTEDANKMKARIQDAFDARMARNNLIDNTREQFERNRSGN
jgi:hypothetical protein